MDIKTRSQAIADGDKTYFTGKLCKNGHKTYRYVLSGSCSDCVNSSRVFVNSSTRNEALAALTEQSELRDKLTLAKFRCFPSDVDDIKLMVYASVLMRFPDAVFDQVDPKLPATDLASGTGVYALYCHIDDLTELKADTNKLTMQRHPLDIAGACKKILEKNLSEIK